MTDCDVVIAGGGLGGLFTAALLARNGKTVTVLEKNAIAGGGLQSFCRHGVSYDTGMHVLGGMRPGGSVNRILSYLGVRDKIKVKDIPDACMDSVTSLDDGVTYIIPAGRQAFVDVLSGYFPGERDSIAAYVKAITEIADSFDLFNLRPYSHVPALTASMPRQALLPVDEFINSFVSDSRLRGLLSYINGLYGGEPGRTPAYVHALIMSLYLDGASRFVDDTHQLVTRLQSVIVEAGGQLLCNKTVEGIQIDADRRVSSMVCSDGTAYYASSFVWAAHPSLLLKIIPQGVFSKAFQRRISSIKPTCSAFSVFIEFHPDAFPYIDHTCYIHDDMSADPWNLAEGDSDGFPRALMYMTPPVSGQGPFATKMLVNALMNFDRVQQWAGTQFGNRPDGYQRWKDKVADSLIAKIERVHPNLRPAIKRMYTASPLTVSHFYGAPCGSVYGFSKDASNIFESQLPIVTKSPNLFLTGQCINLHGFCGVPLTALTTAEAILYPLTILDRL